MEVIKLRIWVYALLIWCVFSCKKASTGTLYPQFPSPMVDHIRSHERIPLKSIPIKGRVISLLGDKEGRLFLNSLGERTDSIPLLIHFHGDYRVAQEAVEQFKEPLLLLHCHWGGGSSSYGRPLISKGPDSFMEEVRKGIQDTFLNKQITTIYVSAWSAGYGAIRELIRSREVDNYLEGILLMDGLHCSYVPERRTLAEGGSLDSLAMEPFVQWAIQAKAGGKSFFITHSSVFPGTYASTTETASYLLRRMEVGRQSVLLEGPMGMQQTSTAKESGFTVLSYAGNSAPDHVDHYHAFGNFIHRWLEK